MQGRERFEEICSENNVVFLFPQVLSPEQQIQAASNDYNFDHPDAFDFNLLTHTLRKLKQGKSVKIPVYDFTTHGRQKDWVRMNAHTPTCSVVFAVHTFVLVLCPLLVCVLFTHC